MNARQTYCHIEAVGVEREFAGGGVGVNDCVGDGNIGSSWQSVSK